MLPLNYMRLVIATVCALAAMMAQIFAMVVTAPIAAVGGIMVSLIWMARVEKVSKAFKSDVERILDGDTSWLQIGATWCLFAGLLCAYVIAGFWPAPIAAILGIMITGFVMKAMFK